MCLDDKTMCQSMGLSKNWSGIVSFMASVLEQTTIILCNFLLFGSVPHFKTNPYGFLIYPCSPKSMSQKPLFFLAQGSKPYETFRHIKSKHQP